MTDECVYSFAIEVDLKRGNEARTGVAVGDTGQARRNADERRQRAHGGNSNGEQREVPP